MNNEMKKACEKNASDQIAKLQAFPEDISIRRVSPVGHIEVWKMNYTIRKMEPDEYEILKDFYMKRSSYLRESVYLLNRLSNCRN